MTIDSFTGEYRFLSNFWQSRITDPGSTVEHWYQAMKTLVPEEQQRIIEAPTPGEAKRLGRTVTLRPDWDDIKLDIMLLLVRQKFYRSQIYTHALLATGDEELVEGNTWGDTYWGVCKGVGENHLGKILMQVREELKPLGPFYAAIS